MEILCGYENLRPIQSCETCFVLLKLSRYDGQSAETGPGTQGFLCCVFPQNLKITEIRKKIRYVVLWKHSGNGI